MGGLDSYAGKKVLITGGLGFIGSNLANRLVDLGANVSVMDAKLPRYGANDFNVSVIRDKINVDISDIRDKEAVLRNIKGKDIIFSLAAQVDHNFSMQEPGLDLDINCQGHLNILDSCKKENPESRILFPGSRMQYGRVLPNELPVKEEHSLNPLSIYAVHKSTGELYYRAYNQHHKLDTMVFRITNPFGPKAQVKHPGYGIVNWFVRQALEGKPLTIYGDGNQLRDYIFIEDLVEALTIGGIHPNPKERVYNLGSGTPISFKEMVESVSEIIGSGNVKHIPWPENIENVETGDFYSDISRISKEFGWKPTNSFTEGLEKTARFYRQHIDKYK